MEIRYGVKYTHKGGHVTHSNYGNREAAEKQIAILQAAPASWSIEKAELVRQEVSDWQLVDDEEYYLSGTAATELLEDLQALAAHLEAAGSIGFALSVRDAQARLQAIGGKAR